MAVENTTKFDYDVTYSVTVLDDTNEIGTVDICPCWLSSDRAHWDKLTYHKQHDLIHKSAVEVYADTLSVSIAR